MHFKIWLCFCIITVALLTPNPSAAADGLYTCPVTTPSNPEFVPPTPYRATAYQDAFWYGSRELWTSLPFDGVWRLGRTKAGFSNKLFLWEEGYDGRKNPNPDITVVLNRLDTTAPPVTSRGGTNAYFDYTWHMLTGVTFPTEGCWKVTSYHDGHTLSFQP